MSSSDNRWVLPAGSTAREGWESVVDDAPDDWHHTGLRIAALDQDQSLTVEAGAWEYVVVPLSGAARVLARRPDGGCDEAILAGRPSVFSGPTDVVFAPAGTALTLTATAPTARIAVCAARVDGVSEQSFRHLAAAEVPVELRGAGSARRGAQLRNSGRAGCRPIIVCEVITPAENWSSYPPHKHDEERPGSRDSSSRRFTTSRPGRGAAAGGVGERGSRPRSAYQRVLVTAGEHRHQRDGAHRRHRAGAVRVARSRGGRSRLRPVLPQCDGGARPRPGPGGSATIRPTAGFAARGTGCREIPACPTCPTSTPRPTPRRSPQTDPPQTRSRLMTSAPSG